MGNSFPALCSFKLEQSVESLNLENVVSFHFPYLTLISVLLLTEVSFRYQDISRTVAAPPPAVTQHGAVQCNGLINTAASIIVCCPHYLVSGVHWPASVSVSTLCSFRISCLGWAGLDWAGQHKSPYVIFTKVAPSARLPTSVLPLTREKISLIKDSPHLRPRFIHHCVFQESSDCSIVKCDYYDTDTAAPVSIFDPMLSSLPLSSISSLGIRAVNEPSQSCTVLLVESAV